jgi:hypothetical protein
MSAIGQYRTLRAGVEDVLFSEYDQLADAHAHNFIATMRLEAGNLSD